MAKAVFVDWPSWYLQPDEHAYRWSLLLYWYRVLDVESEASDQALSVHDMRHCSEQLMCWSNLSTRLDGLIRNKLNRKTQYKSLLQHHKPQKDQQGWLNPVMMLELMFDDVLRLNDPQVVAWFRWYGIAIRDTADSDGYICTLHEQNPGQSAAEPVWVHNMRVLHRVREMLDMINACYFRSLYDETCPLLRKAFDLVYDKNDRGDSDDYDDADYFDHDWFLGLIHEYAGNEFTAMQVRDYGIHRSRLFYFASKESIESCLWVWRQTQLSSRCRDNQSEHQALFRDLLNLNRRLKRFYRVAPQLGMAYHLNEMSNLNDIPKDSPIQQDVNMMKKMISNAMPITTTIAKMVQQAHQAMPQECRHTFITYLKEDQSDQEVRQSKMVPQILELLMGDRLNLKKFVPSFEVQLCGPGNVEYSEEEEQNLVPWLEAMTYWNLELPMLGAVKAAQRWYLWYMRLDDFELLPQVVHSQLALCLNHNGSPVQDLISLVCEFVNPVEFSKRNLHKSI